MSIRAAFLPLLLPLFFGPPSIKVHPVDPAVTKTNGTVFTIIAHHHGEATSSSVSGRAEGVVAGKRISRPLTMIAGKAKGEFSVRQEWTAGQPWVLVFTITDPEHGDEGVAEAVVKVNGEGAVKGIEYPMGKLNNYDWPRRAAAKEIDAALRSMTRP